jgi:hypothetical protein
MVGFAKTATIRARDPVSGSSYLRKRLDYLAASPRPSIVVIEDKDEPPGYGAFWGEVQTNVHKALDCLGTVTNGSIRDLAAVAVGSSEIRHSAGELWGLRLRPAHDRLDGVDSEQPHGGGAPGGGTVPQGG